MILSEKNKKRIIAGLLLALCLTSAAILIYNPDFSSRTLSGFAEADSLITRELERFNIKTSQVSILSITVDTHFTRKSYRINVPPGFSKTQFHAELNHTFYAYGVTIPARVTFPNRDMKIYLVYNNTVLRNLSIQTDPSLVLERNPASILMVFDSSPPERLLQGIIDFGETISIVLVVEDPAEARKLQQDLSGRYPFVTFWLKDGKDGDIFDPGSELTILPRLQLLKEAVPAASILAFGSPESREDTKSRASSSGGLTFIDAGQAQLLDARTGKPAFDRELLKFLRKASNREHPVAIIKASRDAIDWLKERLPEFKRSGMVLTPAPEIEF